MNLSDEVADMSVIALATEVRLPRSFDLFTRSPASG
jgi:hypothetical protein